MRLNYTIGKPVICVGITKNNGERFCWMMHRTRVFDALKTIVQAAHNPELSFDKDDAAQMSYELRSMLQQYDTDQGS